MRVFGFTTPILLISSILSILSLFSCSKDSEHVRIPQDILGVWAPEDIENLYFEYSNNNEVHKLQVEFQDDESIGIWTKDVYYYEPGYNLVIYVASERFANVYQIMNLSDSFMTWCWVDEVEVKSSQEVGHIIGDIIKKAQEGYRLDPELFESFRYVPENQFFQLLESLDIDYPWDY